jgi:hypothetical protein
MSTLIKSAFVLIACYFAAWLAAFLIMVGFEPSLMARYFLLGWTFRGLELVSLVWLLTWPIFLVALVAYHFIRRRLSVPSERPA